MKTITSVMTANDVEVGDKFLNTTIFAISKPWREKDVGGHWRTYVQCRCECGNEFRGRWDRLHTTHSDRSPWTSRCAKCGTGKKRKIKSVWCNESGDISQINLNQIDDLTGQYFGDLYVNKIVGRDGRGHILYECICSCGNVEVFAGDRIKGNKSTNPRAACTKCLNHISNGEKWVKLTLEKLHINYKKEFIFEDLIGDKGGYLRFDFALLNKENKPYALIEYQGEQHYKIVDHWGGQKGLEQRQRHDQEKRDYCKSKGITLIEIPYTKLRGLSNE